MNEITDRYLLVVGYGSIGRRHVGNIRKIFPDIGVVLWRHRRYPEENQKLKQQGIHCVEKLEAALAFNPLAAIIANPATCHLKAAAPLARAGVHLFVEKPLAASSDGVEALISLCRRQKLVCMVGYNFRFSRSLRFLRARLKDGAIGNVQAVQAVVGQYLPDWRPENDYRQGVSARKELGGGVLLELSHEIDYLQWLFGPVRSVAALISRQSNLEIDVEDSAALLLTMQQRDRAGKMIASLHMDFIRRDPARTCTIIGSKGTLLWDGIADSVSCFMPEKGEWESIYAGESERNSSYLAELEHFFDCVKSGAEPLAPAEDGLRVLRVIDAARKASRTGMTVLVD